MHKQRFKRLISSETDEPLEEYIPLQSTGQFDSPYKDLEDYKQKTLLQAENTSTKKGCLGSRSEG